MKKITEYINENSKDGNKPKNNNLIASIEDIKLAVVESFWIGDKAWIPEKNEQWCEIWLNINSDESENEFRKITAELNIGIKKERLCFPERRVVFAYVNADKLKQIIERTDLIAEIRRASEPANFFTELENKEQSDWVKDLFSRIKITNDLNTTIGILDTGVNNGHLLINPVLKDTDCYVYDSSWTKRDVDGHGTGMAGLCIYGDLQKDIESCENIELDHLIESYKILPSEGKNDPELYGAITSQAVSDLYINEPDKRRVICMAITAPKFETGEGNPSSWSAGIDELTSGAIDEIKKLFIVSAGNVTELDDFKKYPTSNQTKTVQNPAQSWNALTVGAYTEKTNFDTSECGDLDVLAQRGELSPYSTTSLLWDSKWPVKPEILMEGGNLIKDSTGCYQCEDLSILTTNNEPTKKQFTTIWATSAATAEAAWMAATIQNLYPNAWPETVRGLIVHSATWTDSMKKQFLKGESKTDYRTLLRTCGYGVPDLNKAIKCANNSVNLIIQSELQPFDKEGSKYKTKDMNIHEIPWPKEVLEGLRDVKVSMKVTLSYFIEPGPGEVGWKDKYRYASCGLRFDVNGIDTKEDFIARITKYMENEDEEVIHKSSGSSIPWVLGPNNRNVGSIHSDIWEGTAGQLATSNLIAIYPTIGWWRERHYLKRWNRKIRYSLIISLSTPKVTTDLYNPIVNIIKAKNMVEINVTKN